MIKHLSLILLAAKIVLSSDLTDFNMECYNKFYILIQWFNTIQTKENIFKCFQLVLNDDFDMRTIKCFYEDILNLKLTFTIKTFSEIEHQNILTMNTFNPYAICKYFAMFPEDSYDFFNIFEQNKNETSHRRYYPFTQILIIGVVSQQFQWLPKQLNYINRNALHVIETTENKIIDISWNKTLVLSKNNHSQISDFIAIKQQQPFLRPNNVFRISLFEYIPYVIYVDQNISSTKRLA